MKLTDTHCHIYAPEFDGDRMEMMQRSKDSGIEKYYLPAIDSHTHEAMLEAETNFPQCKAMMGLHPCSVNETYKSELRIVEEWLEKRSFAAIGEIGLDYYRSTGFAEPQQKAFTMQMQLALDKNLPVVIHTRNAMQPTIDMVKSFAGKGLRGIFHCFGGNKNEARQIVNMGFCLGIGGILTYKKSGLPEALEDVSLENIVLETDAPYLPPTPYRGKRNESSYLPFVAQKLAEIKNVAIEEVAAITTANTEKIFRG